MRIFLAGGSGALGRRLAPLLVAEGHHVVAATRTFRKMDALRAAGAEPGLIDGLNGDDVMRAVSAARPEVIIHQMTALAGVRAFRSFDEEFALTNRLRTEGTDHLLAAARAAGARRFSAQSYTGWPNIREGGRVKTEDDPLDPHLPPTMTQTIAAPHYVETTVTALSDMSGLVLRYGSLYGPGTSIGADGDIVRLARRRQFPIIGGGAGVWSFTPYRRRGRSDPAGRRNAGRRACTILSTTSRPKCGSGCLSWHGRSAPTRPFVCRDGSDGSLPARPCTC